MARNSVIKAIITGDTKGLDSALGRADTGLSKFAKGAGLAFAGIAGAGAAAIAVGKPLVEAASSYTEALNRSQVIFGDAAGSIEQFADTADSALGLSARQALSATSDFAAFGQSAGLTGGDLADFSTTLAGAAADLGSFNDLDTDEALAKLRSGLAGEAEPLRQLGIFLDEATVAAAAMELGLGDATGALTDQEKVLARNHAILQQMGDQGSMGDFARTSDSLANQQKALAAQFENVQAKIGEKLLPVAIELAEIALDIVGGIEKVIDVFSEDGLAGVLDMISEKFEAFDTVRAIVAEVVERVTVQIEAVRRVFEGIIDFVAGVFTGDWTRAWDGIKNIFGGVWDSFTGTIDTAWDAITLTIQNFLPVLLGLAAQLGTNIVLGIAHGLTSLGEAIWGMVQAAWDYVVQKFNELQSLNFAEKIPVIGGTLFGNAEIGSNTQQLSGLSIPAPPGGGTVNVTVPIELDGRTLTAVERQARLDSGN